MNQASLKNELTTFTYSIRRIKSATVDKKYKIPMAFVAFEGANRTNNPHNKIQPRSIWERMTKNQAVELGSKIK